MGHSYLTRPRQPENGHRAAQGPVGKVVSLGMQLATPPAMGAMIDLNCNTPPWFSIAGALVGFGLFFLGILQLAKIPIAQDKLKSELPTSVINHDLAGHEEDSAATLAIKKDMPT